jgi:hypothetical protein
MLKKSFPLVIRQAHHEWIHPFAVRPELVEGHWLRAGFGGLSPNGMQIPG